MQSFMTVDGFGNKIWKNYKGQYHREDGPAIQLPSGTKSWYIKGKHHRADGPAIERADGYKAWYINDKCHREDGPAIEFADGRKYWYINDKELTELEFNAWRLANKPLVYVDMVIRVKRRVFSNDNLWR
jgi:hypothetical protein